MNQLKNNTISRDTEQKSRNNKSSERNMDIRKRKSNEKKKGMIHPLIHQCLVKSLYHDIYHTVFNPDALWVIKEYNVLKTQVLPATSYIEMAVESCKNYYQEGMEINHLSFLEPMIFEESLNRECHTILSKNNKSIDVKFISKKQEDELGKTWVRHAECSVNEIEGNDRRYVDIDLLKERLELEEKTGSIFSKKNIISNHETAIQLGPHWGNEKVLASGKTEVLFSLSLKDEFVEELNLFNLHLSLFDDAIHAIISNTLYGLYLPFFFRSVRIYSNTPRYIYSHVTIKNTDMSNLETITLDVELIDEEGKVFAELEDYILKHVTKTSAEFRTSGTKEFGYYRLKWIESTMESSDMLENYSRTFGKTVVFVGESPLCIEMVEVLKDYADLIVVHLGNRFNRFSYTGYEVGCSEESFDELCSNLKSNVIGRIIFAYSLDEKNIKEINNKQELEKFKKKGIDSLFYLAKALIKNNFMDDIDVVLLADHAYPVTNDQVVIKPHNAAVLAMGKAMAKEYPNLKCRALDIDHNMSCYELIHEIMKEKSTYQIAYRKNIRYMERMDRVLLENNQTKFKVRRNGVYMITGGLKGVGLAVAKYIAQKEKVKIVLVEESGFPGKIEWFDILNGDNEKQKLIIKSILEIEGLGSEVILIQADVANEEEMSSVIETISCEYGFMNGVLHCAEYTNCEMIVSKDKSEFDKVVTPKIEGTWVLYNLFKENELDFFVLYSSMLSLFEVASQSDSIVANTYIDSFAALMKKSGVNAYSINWPTWKEFEDFKDDHDSYAKGITNDEAFASLERIIGSPAVQILPALLNKEHFKENKEQLSFEISEGIINKIDLKF